MDRTQVKRDLFVEFAVKLARLSTCRRAQVGAVITDRSFRGMHAMGYNGPPRKCPNDSCTGLQGACGCVHAEANALIKLGDVSDLVLITTTAPCVHCAGLIINSEKVSQVLFMAAYRDAAGVDRLREAGIAYAGLT